MAKPKIKPHQVKSVIQQTLEKRKSSKDLEKDGNFLVSFKHLDKEQGDSLYTWEQQNMLAHSIDVLSGYCQSPLNAQLGEKFTIYGDFPPSDKTKFFHPKHVPEDAQWARIHVDGTQILAGHVAGGVFYVVFLDPDQSFYLSQLRNT